MAGHTSRSSSSKVLKLDNMNPHVKVMEYAVRGPLVIRAGQIEAELQQVSVLFCDELLFFLLNASTVI